MKHLGEYLIEDGALTREALDAALARQRQQQGGQAKRIGDVLLEMGAVSPQQIQRAVQRQQRDRAAAT